MSIKPFTRRFAEVTLILLTSSALADAASFTASGNFNTTHSEGPFGPVDDVNCQYGVNNFNNANPSVPFGSTACASAFASGSSTAAADSLGDHVFASVSTLGPFSGADTARTISDAEVSSNLTIDAPGLTGQSGSFVPIMQIDGTLDSSGTGFSAAIFSEDVSHQTFFQGQQNASVAVNTTVNTPFGFVYGTQFLFSFDLQVTSSIAFATSGGNDAGTATADFSNTASVVGFTIFDASGNPVGDAMITSDGSIDYQSIYSGVATGAPEPASIVMTLGGLLAVLKLKRRTGNPL